MATNVSRCEAMWASPTRSFAPLHFLRRPVLQAEANMPVQTLHEEHEARNRLGLLVEPDAGSQAAASASSSSSWCDLMVDAGPQTLITADHVTPGQLISEARSADQCTEALE